MRDFQLLRIVRNQAVATVELLGNQVNAVHDQSFCEIQRAFKQLDGEETTHVVILTGDKDSGHFCGGLHIPKCMQMFHEMAREGASSEKLFLSKVTQWGAALHEISQCRKPVIGAVDGACIGAGLDILSACDVIYATKKARFALKEIQLGFIADLGALQRLPPRVSSYSTLADWALTGRDFGASEALQNGLVSRIFNDYSTLMDAATKLATTMAGLNPKALYGTKHFISSMIREKYERERDAMNQAGAQVVGEPGRLETIADMFIKGMKSKV